MEEKIKSIERIEISDGRADLKVQCAEREYVLHNVKFQPADDCLEYDDATPSEVNLKFEYDIVTESKKDKLTSEQREYLNKAFKIPLSVEAQKAYETYPYAGKSNFGVIDPNSELRNAFVLGWRAHTEYERTEIEDKIFVSGEGVTIPWKVLDEMRSSMLEMAVNANHPNKKLYRQGQLSVYERLLELKDNLEK